MTIPMCAEEQAEEELALRRAGRSQLRWLWRRRRLEFRQKGGREVTSMQQLFVQVRGGVERQ